MPSIVLSHQAPAIGLKIAFPRYFDGIAMCIAATAPDMELVVYRLIRYVTKSDPWVWGISHSLLGLLVWVLPLSLIGCVLFSRWLGPCCAKLAQGENKISSLLAFFGVDQWTLLKKKKFNFKWFLVASYSAVVGGVTHLFLDIFSHKNIHLLFPFSSTKMPDFLKEQVADFGTVDFGIFKYDFYLDWARLSWLIMSFVTAVLTLWALRYIKKHDLLNKWYSNT